MQEQKFKDILKKNRYHITGVRLNVFRVLAANKPLSMAELIGSCLPHMDRASVYRTIELFEDLGITRRFQLGWKYRIELSDIFHEHHHHLECLNCHRVVDFETDRLLEQKIHEAAAQMGFKATEHNLEVRGLCANCRKNK